MAERFVTAVVWAEFDVLESISRGFRPENKALGMGDLALVMLFIGVVSAIAWAVSRYLGRLDPQRPTHSPRSLFAELGASPRVELVATAIVASPGRRTAIAYAGGAVSRTSTLRSVAFEQSSADAAA
ncbi:MAG: hypothetical protein R3C10_19430 [Pirellulales bacterium]